MPDLSSEKRGPFKSDDRDVHLYFERMCRSRSAPRMRYGVSWSNKPLATLYATGKRLHHDISSQVVGERALCPLRHSRKRCYLRQAVNTGWVYRTRTLKTSMGGGLTSQVLC